MPTSPLHESHVAAGDRLVDFAGWMMPISTGLGTVAEHMACRQDVARFDVSHLATLEFTGAEIDRVAQLVTNDLGRIAPGKTQYSLVLNDAGGIIDDLILWWIDEATLHVLPNAANVDQVQMLLGGRNITSERALIAVQGPHARERLAEISADASRVARNTVTRCVVAGAECLVAGTGYTGEDGVEIAVPAAEGLKVWSALASLGIPAAGLGARDTLRLEAGYPLHGAELTPEFTPQESGVAWAVKQGRGFPGEAALIGHHPRVRRVGLVTEGRRPPRAGCRVLVDGRDIGEVTSGNLSPVLGHGIALARVEASVEIDGSVMVDVRGHHLEGRQVTAPFVSLGV
jgi:aminomethyltransferase